MACSDHQGTGSSQLRGSGLFCITIWPLRCTKVEQFPERRTILLRIYLYKKLSLSILNQIHTAALYTHSSFYFPFMCVLPDAVVLFCQTCCLQMLSFSPRSAETRAVSMQAQSVKLWLPQSCFASMPQTSLSRCRFDLHSDKHQVGEN